MQAQMMTRRSAVGEWPSFLLADGKASSRRSYLLTWDLSTEHYLPHSFTRDKHRM